MPYEQDFAPVLRWQQLPEPPWTVDERYGFAAVKHRKTSLEPFTLSERVECLTNRPPKGMEMRDLADFPDFS